MPVHDETTSAISSGPTFSAIIGSGTGPTASAIVPCALRRLGRLELALHLGDLAVLERDAASS